ncbi:hypothetical protein GIB67_017524, partial [Kingdonia uniflora]
PTPPSTTPVPPPPPTGSKSSPSPLSPPTANAPPKKTTPASHTPSGNSSSSSSSSPTTNNDSSSNNLPLIVGISVGIGLLLVIMAVIIFMCCRKKKKKQSKEQMHYFGGVPKGNQYYDQGAQNPNWYNSPHKSPVPTVGWAHNQTQSPHKFSSSEMSSNLPSNTPSPNMSLGFNKSSFSYEDLATATNGFSQANLLGQGGFGYVHKGVMPDGKLVAVKSLKSGSGQGEREFQAEVEIISRVHHRHLVSLVGYCIAGAQRMLVYEFVTNNTMEYHLHGKGRPPMDWSKRLTIALGSAKGLAYLHEDCHPRIIHRDIKAANILLDDKYEAMVADFGLAKLSSDTFTHVSTRVMGTFGYMAPEYASTGKLTEKSDVFSFGVMLLELITGRRPVDTTNSYMEDSLVDWARPILTQALADGNYDELVDPRLENKYDPNEMALMIASAAASIRHSAKRRPKMSQIVRALEGESTLEDLNDMVKSGQSPAYTSSSDYTTGTYNKDMKRFREMAIVSREQASSEYSGTTSVYGLNPSPSSSDISAESSQEMKK